MAAPWCTPDKGENGAVIGEIYFGPGSANLGGGDRKEIDKLANILATFNGVLHDFDKPKIQILGDRDPKEDAKLAENRARSVERYLKSKIPPTGLHPVSLTPA